MARGSALFYFLGFFFASTIAHSKDPTEGITEPVGRLCALTTLMNLPEKYTVLKVDISDFTPAEYAARVTDTLEEMEYVARRLNRDFHFLNAKMLESIKYERGTARQTLIEGLIKGIYAARRVTVSTSLHGANLKLHLICAISYATKNAIIDTE